MILNYPGNFKSRVLVKQETTTSKNSIIFSRFILKKIVIMFFSFKNYGNSFFISLAWEVVTNLDSILKSRDITLPTKIHLVKAMVFPVVIHGCESWSVKKAEHQRIDAFELWCWRRLLRVPWTARRSNQSVLEEINPEYSLEGLMLKLKLRYFGTWCEVLIH